MKLNDALNKLRDDKHYYGKFGSHYLSNSNIGTLLANPRDFGKPSKENINFLIGRFFHVSMLEPEKLNEFDIIDASTRNTKVYKEASIKKGSMLLLSKEVDQLNLAIDDMKSNIELSSQIYDDSSEYEVPMISDFFGVEFKGKADIVNKDKIIDIKTTSSINKFRSSAYAYNYDSQAFIYSSMFGKPFEFFVIGKATRQMKIFKCSDEFLESGMKKVEKAVNIWKRFFGTDATDDVNEYIKTEIL